MFTPNCENMLAIRLYHRRDHFRRRQCDLWGDGWGGGGGGRGDAESEEGMEYRAVTRAVNERGIQELGKLSLDDSRYIVRIIYT